MSFIDNEVIRFKNGVTNRPQGDLFNSMKQPDPTIFSEAIFDFLTFNTVVPGAQPDQTVEGVWTVGTLFGTASAGSVNYFGGTQGVGGRVICTTGATLNDDISWSFGGRPFAFGRNKPAFFKFIGNIENANVPLVNVGVRAGGNNQAPQTGAWWSKPAGVSEFDLNIDRFGTSTALGLTNSPTLVDEDDFEVSFYYDGEQGLWGGINGSALGKFDLTEDNFPYADTSGFMTPFVYIQNGAASAERLDIDLIYWAMERNQIDLEI